MVRGGGGLEVIAIRLRGRRGTTEGCSVWNNRDCQIVLKSELISMYIFAIAVHVIVEI